MVGIQAALDASSFSRIVVVLVTQICIDLFFIFVSECGKHNYRLISMAFETSYKIHGRALHCVHGPNVWSNSVYIRSLWPQTVDWWGQVFVACRWVGVISHYALGESKTSSDDNRLDDSGWFQRQQFLWIFVNIWCKSAYILGLSLWVCVHVCVCVRACVRACVCVCVEGGLLVGCCCRVVVFFYGRVRGRGRGQEGRKEMGGPLAARKKGEIQGAVETSDHTDHKSTQSRLE